MNEDGLVALAVYASIALIAFALYVRSNIRALQKPPRRLQLD
jgi:hypothetical protein